MTNPTDPPTFRCSDPAVVAAYRDAVADYRASETAALAAARTLPDAEGVHYVLGQYGYPDRLVGYLPTDPKATPPAGWRVRGRRRTVYFAPAYGPAGEEARRWIHDHQLRNDPRLVLRSFGLPQNGRKPTGQPDGGFYVTRTIVFEHEATIWVRYTGTPDGPVDGRWEPVRMSAWYAAREAYDDARQAAIACGEEPARVR